MREKSTGKIMGGAGVVAALAATGTLFAGAGLVGKGVGSFDLWPDWTGTPRPSVEVAARSPNGPGVNPLLPLNLRADGRRAVGGATAALVLSPTTFSAGPDVTTADLVFALTPLTWAPALGASSLSPYPAADVAPATPSAPADKPAPAAQPAPSPVPVRQPSRPVAPQPAEREQVASVPSRDRSSRPSKKDSGPSKASSAGAAGGGQRPVPGRDGPTSTTPSPSETVADPAGRVVDGSSAVGEPADDPLPATPPTPAAGPPAAAAEDPPAVP